MKIIVVTKIILILILTTSLVSSNEIKMRNKLCHMNYEEVNNTLWNLYEEMDINDTLIITEPHFSGNNAYYPNHKTFYNLNTFRDNTIIREDGLIITNDFPPFKIQDKKIILPKMYLYFWNYIIEPIININHGTKVIWENTGLRSIFPATYISYEMKK